MIRSPEPRESRIEGIWNAAGGRLRRRVADVVIASAEGVASEFYAKLLEDEEASSFLDHGLVRARLSDALVTWLQRIFRPRDSLSGEEFLRRSREVGAIHARIDVPMSLVGLGMRVVKKALAERLVEASDTSRETAAGVLFMADVLDQALDGMNDAYLSEAMNAARQRQSLKLDMAGPHLALECERLKTSVFRWCRDVVTDAFENGGSLGRVPTVKEGDVGLWVNHKAEFAVGESPEFDALREGLDKLDRIYRVLVAGSVENPVQPADLAALSASVNEVVFLLTQIADKALESEAGRDALTRLLNRRYLPSILQQEVALSRTHGIPFAVLLIDFDHFKAINDRHGHPVGDRILAITADTLLGRVRAGDFVFRYGGEEFLVLLAEVDQDVAHRRAEDIREAIETMDCGELEVDGIAHTISIGVALHDGHPDYEHTIRAADEALYRAKDQGRNRVVVA